MFFPQSKRPSFTPIQKAGEAIYISVDILVSAFLDCQREGNKFWSKSYQALPPFNLLINSSGMHVIC
jgi:hypothetical protein